MSRSSIALVVASCLAGGTGFWLGRFNRIDPAVHGTHGVVAAAPNVDAPRASAPATVTPAHNARSEARALSLVEILASSGPMERLQALFTHIQGLKFSELEATLQDLRKQKQSGRLNEAESLIAAHLLLTRYGAQDPAGAMAYVFTLDPFSKGLGASAVLSSLAAKDPAAAAKLLADSSDPVLRIPLAANSISTNIAKEWARRDPAAALVWAKSLPGGQRGAALNGLISSVAVDDPLKASALAGELPAGEERTRVLGQIAESWSARDPEAALTWAQGLAPAEATKAREQALAGWARQDPAAASMYIDQAGASADKDKLLSSVAGLWAQKDAPSAAAWISQQAEGPGKDKSMRDVLWAWTAADPKNASTWLAAQPASPSKDEAIVSMATQTFATDPEAAMIWGAAISDSGKRVNSLKQGLKQWMAADAPAARSWLDTSALPPEEKTQLAAP